MRRGRRLVELRRRLTNLARSIHAAVHAAGHPAERRRDAAGSIGDRRADSRDIGRRPQHLRCGLSSFADQRTYLAQRYADMS